MASVTGNSAAMASVVLRPLPVMQTTVVSSGLIRFWAMSFCVTPAVTPPAVSVKMPSVSARSLMAATISGSEMSSAQPPDSRICLMAKGPSAGLPMARERTMVLGFCGSKRARLRFTPSEIGERPAELLGNFVAVRFRAFGIVGAQVDVDETPLETVGDLRAEAVDVIVVAVDAHDARAIDGGVEHLGGLEVGGNEDARVEALLSGLRGDGVGEIAGR